MKCSVHPIIFADVLPRLFLTARHKQLGGAWNELLLTYTIVWKSSQVAWESLETWLPASFVSFQLWKQPVTLLEQVTSEEHKFLNGNVKICIELLNLCHYLCMLVANFKNLLLSFIKQVHVCQYCMIHVPHPMKLNELPSPLRQVPQEQLGGGEELSAWYRHTLSTSGYICSQDPTKARGQRSENGGCSDPCRGDAAADVDTLTAGGATEPWDAVLHVWGHLWWKRRRQGQTGTSLPRITCRSHFWTTPLSVSCQALCGLCTHVHVCVCDLYGAGPIV